MNRKKIRILMYHGVGRQQTDFRLDDPCLVTSTENFEKQVKFLSKSYNIISLADFANHIKKKIPFLPHSLIITFDDGLKNNFINAFPILQKYNATATIFLMSGYMGTSKITWYEKISYFINKISLAEFVEEFKRKFPDYGILMQKINQNDQLMFIVSMFKYKIDDKERNSFIQGLFSKFKITIDQEKLKDIFLSWEEIRKMDEAGIMFGSHTSTHPVLSMLNYENASREIVESKKIIEAELDKNINLFAYPYGDKDSFNSNIKEILINNNYSCAVSTIEGFNNPNSDLFELKRICVVNEESYYFKLRIEGFTGFIEKNYQKLYNYFKK